MLKFLVASLLVGTVLGFSSGDFTVPLNSSNYTGSNIFVAVNIDQANSLATFYAKFNAYGYFSLLFSTSMGGVLIILFRATTTTSRLGPM